MKTLMTYLIKALGGPAGSAARWVMSFLIDYLVGMAREMFENYKTKKRAQKALKEYNESIDKNAPPEIQAERRKRYEDAINSIG